MKRILIIVLMMLLYNVVNAYTLKVATDADIELVLEYYEPWGTFLDNPITQEADTAMPHHLTHSTYQIVATGTWLYDGHWVSGSRTDWIQFSDYNQVISIEYDFINPEFPYQNDDPINQ